jgi:hypothetical protein
MAARGYSPARFSEGATLQQAAQAAFTQRQLQLAAQGQASADLTVTEAAARTQYADFRAVARAVFMTAADRSALNLTGRVTNDKQKFITMARTSYEAAQTAPSADTLEPYGYTVEVLTAALAALDIQSTADVDQNAAMGSATKAAADRNAAIQAIDAWVSQARRISRVALRQRPDLIRKLNPESIRRAYPAQQKPADLILRDQPVTSKTPRFLRRWHLFTHSVSEPIPHTHTPRIQSSA